MRIKIVNTILFIKSEKSVDAWRENADHVYRMALKRQYPGGRSTSYAIIPQSYAKTVKDELPEDWRAFNKKRFSLLCM